MESATSVVALFGSTANTTGAEEATTTVFPFERTPASLTTVRTYPGYGSNPAASRTHARFTPSKVVWSSRSATEGPWSRHRLPLVNPVPAAPVGVTRSVALVPATTSLGTTVAIAGTGTMTLKLMALEMTRSGFTTRSFHGGVPAATGAPVRSTLTLIDPAPSHWHALPGVDGHCTVRGPSGVSMRTVAFATNRSPVRVTVTFGSSFLPEVGESVRMYGATALEGPQVPSTHFSPPPHAALAHPPQCAGSVDVSTQRCSPQVSRQVDGSNSSSTGLHADAESATAKRRRSRPPPTSPRGARGTRRRRRSGAASSASSAGKAVPAPEPQPHPLGDDSLAVRDTVPAPVRLPVGKHWPLAQTPAGQTTPAHGSSTQTASLPRGSQTCPLAQLLPRHGSAAQIAGGAALAGVAGAPCARVRLAEAVDPALLAR